MPFGIGFGIIATPGQGNAGAALGDEQSHDPKMGLTSLTPFTPVLILDSVTIAFTRLPSSLGLLGSGIKDNQTIEPGKITSVAGRIDQRSSSKPGGYQILDY